MKVLRGTLLKLGHLKEPELTVKEYDAWPENLPMVGYFTRVFLGNMFHFEPDLTSSIRTSKVMSVRTIQECDATPTFSLDTFRVWFSGLESYAIPPAIWSKYFQVGSILFATRNSVYILSETREPTEEELSGRRQSRDPVMV